MVTPLQNKMAITIENYSEKAIAVFGDTTSIKEKLLEMGGKFNPNLRGRSGWVFPKSKEKALTTALSKNVENNNPEEQDVEEEIVDKPKRLLKPTSEKVSVECMLMDIIQRLERLEAKLNSVTN